MSGGYMRCVCVYEVCVCVCGVCVCVCYWCVLGCMTIMAKLSPLSLLKVTFVNYSLYVIEIHCVVIPLSVLVSVYRTFTVQAFS